MSDFERVLDKTAGRKRRYSLIICLVRALFWGCLVGLLVWGVHALWPLPYGVWVFVLLPVLTVCGVVGWVWKRRWRREDAASHIDAMLDGDDRFATALECLRRGTRNPVERELLRRVEKDCVTLSLTKVVPLQWPLETKGLGLVVPLFLVLSFLALRVEIVRILTPIVQRTVLAKPLAKLEKRLEALEKSEDPKKRAIAEKIKKLMGELQGAGDFEQMLAKAKELMQMLAAAQDDPEAKQTMEMMGRVAKFLSRSKLTRQISEALKKGDLQKAADLTRSLAGRIRESTGMTPKDLQRLAKNLMRSADAGGASKPASKGAG